MHVTEGPVELVETGSVLIAMGNSFYPLATCTYLKYKRNLILYFAARPITTLCYFV